jgi:hypothetical protein
LFDFATRKSATSATEALRTFNKFLSRFLQRPHYAGSW